MYDIASYLKRLAEINREERVFHLKSNARLGEEYSILTYNFDHPRNGRRVVLTPLAKWLSQAGINCETPLLLLEGDRGLGKSHLAAGIARYLYLTLGLSWEWVYWPSFVDEMLAGNDDAHIARSPFLVLEDLDSAMSVSSRSKSTWLVDKLLSILRPRIEGTTKAPRLPTVIILNRTFDSDAFLKMMTTTTAGEPVPEAERKARTITSLMSLGDRCIFVGKDYRAMLKRNPELKNIMPASPQSLGLPEGVY